MEKRGAKIIRSVTTNLKISLVSRFFMPKLKILESQDNLTIYITNFEVFLLLRLLLKFFSRRLFEFLFSE